MPHPWHLSQVWHIITGVTYFFSKCKICVLEKMMWWWGSLLGFLNSQFRKTKSFTLHLWLLPKFQRQNLLAQEASLDLKKWHQFTRPYYCCCMNKLFILYLWISWWYDMNDINLIGFILISVFSINVFSWWYKGVRFIFKFLYFQSFFLYKWVECHPSVMLYYTLDVNKSCQWV